MTESSTLDRMDRPLDQALVRRRNKIRLAKVLLACAAGAGLISLLSAWISPSVSRNEIRTSVADSGLVEASMSASGSVVPETEEAISSPADTRVLQVLRHPGDRLSKGDHFLALDVSGPTLALDRAQKDIALNANRSAQLKLDQEQALSDLRSQLRIKNLRLTYLQSKKTQEEKMYAIGASSKDQLEQARLEEQIAETEQTGLEQSVRGAEKSLANQLEALATENASLKAERADILKQLEVLSGGSPKGGVLTMVASDVGGTIHRGDIIARISDLTAYRVEAEISDIHSGTIAKGQKARVTWTGGAADGEVSSINPTIESGTVRFSVALSRKSDPRLRSNLRVDVAVLTSQARPGLRIAKGPYLTGAATQEVFVIRSDRAVRTAARLGDAGIDYVEVLGGLQKGDEVIISDMRDYINSKEIRLK
jgi:HlyD family secretion protein